MTDEGRGWSARVRVHTRPLNPSPIVTSESREYRSVKLTAEWEPAMSACARVVFGDGNPRNRRTEPGLRLVLTGVGDGVSMVSGVYCFPQSHHSNHNTPPTLPLDCHTDSIGYANEITQTRWEREYRRTLSEGCLITTKLNVVHPRARLRGLTVSLYIAISSTSGQHLHVRYTRLYGTFCRVLQHSSLYENKYESWSFRRE